MDGQDSVGAPEGAYLQVEVVRDVRIPTADPRITLSANFYRPMTEDRLPVLVVLLPYRRDFLSGLAYESVLIWFAERGYAGLIVDLMGTGSSDGLMRPMLHPDEADDAVAAISWAAEQSWCNGKVGMWGGSYGGYTTLAAALRAPKPLKAIVPMQAPFNTGANVAHYRGSRSDAHILAQRGGSNLVLQILPELENRTSSQSHRRWRTRVEKSEAILVGLARSRCALPNTVWSLDPAGISLPTFCVGGWRDLYCDQTFEVFERVRGPKKLLMGPWMHVLPHSTPNGSADFLPSLLRWWEHWLKGIDNGIMREPAVSFYRQGEESRWQHSETWPMPSEPLIFETTNEAILSSVDQAPMADQPISRQGPIGRYYPDPSIGPATGLALLGREFGRPLNQHEDDSKAFSVSTRPLESALLIVGRPQVRIKLATESPTPGRLVVRLCHVDETGKSEFITMGWSETNCRQEPYVVPLIATSYAVPKGQSLRISVSDADFPRLWPLEDSAIIGFDRIELHLSTTSNEPTVGEVLQAESTDEHSANSNGRWEIRREHVADRLSVAFGADIRGQLPATGTEFRWFCETTSTLNTKNPGGASIQGHYTAEIVDEAGSTVRATAVIHIDKSALRAIGTVNVDEEVIFERKWDLPLYAADGEIAAG